ncbi:MAG: hypothetical protein ACLRMZ_20125 [Blautia marasmi]
MSAGYLTKLDDYVKDYEDWNTSYYESMKKALPAQTVLYTAFRTVQIQGACGTTGTFWHRPA